MMVLPFHRMAEHRTYRKISTFDPALSGALAVCVIAQAAQNVMAPTFDGLRRMDPDVPSDDFELVDRNLDNHVQHTARNAADWMTQTRRWLVKHTREHEVHMMHTSDTWLTLCMRLQWLSRHFIIGRDAVPTVAIARTGDGGDEMETSATAGLHVDHCC